MKIEVNNKEGKGEKMSIQDKTNLTLNYLVNNREFLKSLASQYEDEVVLGRFVLFCKENHINSNDIFDIDHQLSPLESTELDGVFWLIRRIRNNYQWL